MVQALKLYRGGDDVLRPLDAHLDYLERCAIMWERGGGVVGEPDPEQAAHVRAIGARLQATPPVVVCELKVERENGDRDTIDLCSECEPSVDDFLKILKRRPTVGRCDRCGKKAGT